MNATLSRPAPRTRRGLCLTALVLGLVLPTAACGSAVHASSHGYVRAAESTRQVESGQDQTLERIAVLFARRGFAVVARRASKDGTTVVKVKGARAVVWGEEIGSVFYVRLKPAGPGTLVRIHGKPMLNGHEVCSVTDKDVDPCADQEVNDAWVGRLHMTGRDEAEVVRGIVVELGLGTTNRAPAPAEPPPSPPPSVTRL